MSSLSDLLNPAPASGRTSPKPYSGASHLQSHHSAENSSDAGGAVARTTCTYDAASALTALAQSTATPNASWSPTSPYAAYPSLAPGDQYTSRRYSDGRPGSSYGVTAAPVEPSPPMERSEQPISPTLDQYHHGSKSPEEQRRQSIQARLSPPPRLAPIHAFGQVNEEQQGYGQSTSRAVSPPLSSTNASDRKPSEAGNPTNRESSNTRNAPMTNRIRQPSPALVDPKHTSLAESTAALSPAAHIKTEPSATPRENTPAQAPKLDEDSLKAVEALKNEHGLRTSGARKQSSPSVPTMVAESKPSAPASKKRPPPKASSLTKKGTASTVKKPPSKKRKVDPTTDASSPTATATPTSATVPAHSTTPSSRTSKTPAMRGGNAPSSSPAPQPTSSPAGNLPGSDDVDDDEATDENERYCICRRPDNHTWMIACDGGCDDWFHGACVHIAESDGDLIDTYICPNCERAGGGRTTWKAMCRREGCRKPARVGSKGGKKSGKGEKSKYCSEECGIKFFKERLGLEDKEMQKGPKKGRERRKSNFMDNVVNAGEEEDLGSRGGALRVGEVAALVDAVPDLASFRALGEGVLSPPVTVVGPDSKTEESVHDPSASAESFLTESEKASLGRIEKGKEELRSKHSLLKEREKFIATCKEQHTKIAEREGLEAKNICGYDSRLSWSDEQFRAWFEKHKQGSGGTKDGEDELMANGDDTAGDDSGAEGAEVCMKKKCSRHSQWKQLVLQDVRFEVADVSDEMRKVDKEERGIRERAMVRWREKVHGAGDGARVEAIEDIEINAEARRYESAMDIVTDQVQGYEKVNEMGHSTSDINAELRN